MSEAGFPSLNPSFLPPPPPLFLPLPPLPPPLALAPLTQAGFEALCHALCGLPEMEEFFSADNLIFSGPVPAVEVGDQGLGFRV